MTYRPLLFFALLIVTMAACSKTDPAPTSVNAATATPAASATTPPASPSAAPLAASAAPNTSASSAAAAPKCKAGEIVAYRYENMTTPICGKACKKNDDCGADQECGLQAAKSNEPTMGMAAAVANEVMLCSPKASAATCSADQVFGYVNEIPGRGFCSKKCNADSDCLKGQNCVEGRKTNEPTMGMSAAIANTVHMCITKPKK